VENNPANKKTISLPEWPCADRERWILANTDRGIRHTEYAATWKENTRSAYAGIYGRWLRLLTEEFPSLLAEPPAARVTSATVRAFVERLRNVEKLAEITIGGYVATLQKCVRVISPGANVWWVYYLAMDIIRAVSPGPKIETVLSPTLDEVGRRAMDQVILAARRGKHLGINDFRDFRDGLIVSALANTAMRIGAYSQIEVSEIQFVAGTCTIYMPGHKTKTGVSQDYPLTDELSRYMAIYINELRPRLLGGRESSWLWVDEDGRMSRPRIRYRIQKRTKYSLGFVVNPHRFRNAAATFLARESPLHVSAARDVLGHTSFTTTQIYIDIAQSRLAGLRLDEILRAKLNRDLGRDNVDSQFSAEASGFDGSNVLETRHSDLVGRWSHACN
jgi:integrase